MNGGKLVDANQKIEGFEPKSALKRIEDDQELYLELIEMYLEDAPVLIGDLGVAIKEQNFEMASLRSHSLKSTSRTVGAEALGELAAQTEQAIRSCDWKTAEALLPEIKLWFERIRNILSEIAEAP
ncbi:MAG: Hpt domain-containing protein, partial [Fibrobacter sp.]|nr:Hpt domain-containing protein [Fibrobacter sp.]